MRLPEPPIFCITDRRQALRPLPEIAGELHDAGCRWFSVREKDLPTSELAELVRQIRAVAGTALILVHGSAERAAACAADGVHLAAGADPSEARRQLGPDSLIGQSVHTAAEAREAAEDHLDYLVAGPVFPTASKPGYGPALEPSGLSRIVAATPLPVLALGGVAPGTASMCLEAGCKGIAVMGGFMRTDDPAAAFAGFAAALAAE